MDCHLLKEVYVNLLDQKEPRLNFENAGALDIKLNYNKNNSSLRKVIKINKDEIELHKKYLKINLSKNNYN